MHNQTTAPALAHIHTLSQSPFFDSCTTLHKELSYTFVNRILLCARKPVLRSHSWYVSLLFDFDWARFG